MELAGFDELGDFEEGLVNGGGDFVVVGGEPILGLDEAGEGGGGEAEGTQEAQGFRQVIDGAAQFEDAANEDTQHGDLVLQADLGGLIEVGEVDFFEVAGVEAVLEGVAIAGRSAARATMGGGLLRRGRQFGRAGHGW